MVVSSRWIQQFAWVTGMGLMLVACSDNAVSQCNRLTEVTNQTVGDVQSIVSANAPPDSESLRAVAQSFDRGREQMEALELSDEQLQSYQSRFIALYGEVSDSATKLAEALGEQDFETAQEARSTFQAATEKELPLVQEVNDYCGAIAPTP